MAASSARVPGPPELDALGEKVERAKGLIGQLRERSRVLTAELEELRRRLESPELERTARATARPIEEEGESQGERAPRTDGTELKLLRREREEIRERLSRLLTGLEDL